MKNAICQQAFPDRAHKLKNRQKRILILLSEQK
jgi:hypothetical protein